jgi:hypothetical protein
MIDWNKVKFRASSWGNLMTEPREKAAKDRGELSKTCQKELIKIYNLVKYGRKKDIVTKQMTKGTLCEPESITLFSRVEKKLFIKNEERLENEWAMGHPDISNNENIRQATEIHDIKSSWELDTFMPKLVEEMDDGYNCQLQIYFELAGPQAKEGSIAYCLVDAPDIVIQNEMRSLLFNMNVISDEDRSYKIAAAELLNNMVFKDIYYQERVIKQMVYRDDVLIHKMKEKVPKLRAWLTWFEKLHLNGRVSPNAPVKAEDIVLTKIKK